MTEAPAPQRSLVLVKPDGVARGLTGEILRRIESKGYRLVALELRVANRELLEEHYAEHAGKPFFEPLVEFMSSGPLVALVIEGHQSIAGFRSLAGATDPTVAAPGTIRAGEVVRKLMPVARPCTEARHNSGLRSAFSATRKGTPLVPSTSACALPLPSR